MILREQLASYLDDFLSCHEYLDYAPNGLQIEGRGEISSICTAVTADLFTIEQAILHRADALIVHHGYFWKGEEPQITGMKQARIAKLLSKDINLFAYHLPLDCNLLLGNNAIIAGLFQFKSVTQHTANKIQNLLWNGLLAEVNSAVTITNYLEEKFARKPIHIAGTKKEIKNLAWCSGASQDLIEQAYTLGADAYISGEISERTYYQAMELGIHYFACGHHATERGGIQALGEHLAAKFSIKHSFLDSENPI